MYIQGCWLGGSLGAAPGREVCYGTHVHLGQSLRLILMGAQLRAGSGHGNADHLLLGVGSKLVTDCKITVFSEWLKAQGE